MEKVRRFFIKLANWQYFALAVLVLASVLLHLSVITNPQETIFDEAHYVIDARRILNGEGTERVEHPPVAKVLIVTGMKLFGDNPWGWRTPSLLVSTIGLVLFYSICRKLRAPHRVAFLSTFLLTFENLSFLHAGMAMLDEFVVFFMICAFWFYLKGLERKSALFNEWWFFMAIAIALSALSKLSGALSALPIGLHWLLSGYKRPQATNELEPENKNIFSRFGRIVDGYVYSLPFILYALLVPVFFLGLMSIFDWIIWQRWINPVDQFVNMSSLTSSIKFTGYTAPLPSRPWEWLLSPTNSFSLYQYLFTRGQLEIQILGYDWPPYGPHMTGMTSPTIFLSTLAAIPYAMRRAFKGSNPALFALCWFLGAWFIWVPLSLITDRVSFSFYYLPSVPALCLAAALLFDRLFSSAEKRHNKEFRSFIKGSIALFIFFHLAVFCLLSPVKMSISIAASILVLAFTLDYLEYSWQTTASAVIAVTAGVLGLRYILYSYLEKWFGTDTIIGLYPARLEFWAVGAGVTLVVIGVVFILLKKLILKTARVAEFHPAV
jgi:dolichyl-phosphate-mannose-protein mannosyltransferase